MNCPYRFYAGIYFWNFLDILQAWERVWVRGIFVSIL